MANTVNLQILRSYTNTTPISLLDGQLAYSFVSNTLFIGSNTGIIQIGDPSTKVIAQSAYNQANSATILAQSAYNAANAAGSSAYTQAAFNTANNAANTANTASANTIYLQGGLNSANANITLLFAIDIAQNTSISAINTYSYASYSVANTASSNTVYLQGALNSANANIALLTGNVSPNLYTTSISPTVNSIAVGGAPVQNAQVWSTYTMTQVFDAILFPTLGPSYTVPTITLSANNTGTFEIGQSINQSLTVTGTKNDAGPFTQLRITRNGTVINANNSPPATATTNIGPQFGAADPNNPNYFYANTYIDSNTIVSGTTTWQGLGNYSAGLAKLNNKGATDSNAFAVLSTTNPQSANATTFASTTSVITGIYPYFWGVSSTQPTAASIASAIQAGTANKVLAVGSGTLTITYNASSQYVWLAVQNTYAAKTTWYNTALNNGSIGVGQFILSPVSQSVTSPNAFWSGITYRIYISGFATTTSGSIQFS